MSIPTEAFIAVLIAVGGLIGILVKLLWFDRGDRISSMEKEVAENRRNIRTLEDSMTSEIDRVRASLTEDLNQQHLALLHFMDDTYVRKEYVVDLRTHLDQRFNSLEKLIEAKVRERKD